MLKQVIIVVLLSMLAIVFAHQLNQVLQLVVTFHHLLAQTFESIFAGGKLGRFMRDLFALLIPPLFLAAIIELIARLLRQESTRYAVYGLWILWLILLVLVGIH